VDIPSGQVFIAGSTRSRQYENAAKNVILTSLRQALHGYRR